MNTPAPLHPCPWCTGTEFLVVESAFLEVTDFGRRFDAVVCKSCGSTNFFTKTPMSELKGRSVQAPAPSPYR
jgi:hypothetical protein